LVETVGVTEMVLPLADVLHEYVVAPLPVSTAELPLQTTVLLAETVTVGVGITETVLKAEFVQLFEVPVTEKLLLPGPTVTTIAAEVDPVFQV
jgi:hypothetical protein